MLVCTCAYRCYAHESFRLVEELFSQVITVLDSRCCESEIKGLAAQSIVKGCCDDLKEVFALSDYGSARLQQKAMLLLVVENYVCSHTYNIVKVR